MGVWIETALASMAQARASVTPYVGVWIETDVTAYSGRIMLSHPTWVCGLKLAVLLLLLLLLVTPYVGVWIETAVG